MKKQKMPITLADVVTLLHRPLLSLLWTKDLSALYVRCGHFLPEDVRLEYRDYLATQELSLFAVNNSCQPRELRPTEEDVLEEGRHRVRAIPHGPDDSDYEEGDQDYSWEFGWVSESESEGDFTLGVLRREREYERKLFVKRGRWLRQKAKEAGTKPVDTDNVEQLTQLLNTAEKGFGTRFFADTTDQARVPHGIVEEHWNGIDVDLDADITTCRFCASTSNPLLHQHCEAIFQPLKKHMLRHLKHVRYVRPVGSAVVRAGPSGSWTSSQDSLQVECCAACI